MYNKWDIVGLIAGFLGTLATVLGIVSGVKTRDDIDSRIDMALDRRAEMEKKERR